MKSTAADVMKELAADAEFVQQRRAREQSRIAKAAELTQAELPLVAALRAGGIQLNSVWDLVNRKNDYPVAVSILIQHLHERYPEEILEGIARALAIPNAMSVRPILIVDLRTRFVSNPSVQYAICLALAATTNASNLNETVELARETTLGTCRAGLLSALKKHRKKQAFVDQISELRTDPTLAAEINSWR